MTPPRRRALSGLLGLLLVAGLAGPVSAWDPEAGEAIAALDEVTRQLDGVTRRAERRMNAGWDRAVAVAVNLVSLERLDRAIANARVDAGAALEPIIGFQSTGAVRAALDTALRHEDMGYLEQRDHEMALAGWDDYRRAWADAATLRDTLREGLGLPVLAGLRACPLEDPEPFEADWGDSRGWWRSHRGNDINAPDGARLVAMERGEVIQMGWHWLGGNGLYIRGEVTGDVYYYAHLSGYADGIEVGTPVEAGQLVAFVGSTGNSDIPHLHLGWMPGAGRVDLDGLDDAFNMLVDLCF